MTQTYQITCDLSIFTNEQKELIIKLANEAFLEGYEKGYSEGRQFGYQEGLNISLDTGFYEE